MSHQHHHHGHPNVPGEPGTARSRRPLFWAFLINLVFLIVEVVGGVISGSMALLADAGHMMSDVLALGTAVWVSRAMSKPATSRRTYGYGRLEVLSGFVNGIVLWGVVIFIVVEALKRLMEPAHVDASIMLPIAVAGLLANVGSAAVLFAHRKSDLNLRSAFLHLAADAAGSVGAILASVAIMVGGWLWVDTLASIVIGGLVFFSSWSLVRDSVNILLEGTPPSLDMDEVRRDLEGLDGVENVHDLHAWLIASGEPMLTAHLIPEDGCDTQDVLKRAHEIVHRKHDVAHTTFQIEHRPCPEMHD